MGITRINVKIRNPAEPERVWEVGAWWIPEQLIVLYPGSTWKLSD